MESGNLHLATLIAQIGRDETTRQELLDGLMKTLETDKGSSSTASVPLDK